MYSLRKTHLVVRINYQKLIFSQKRTEYFGSSVIADWPTFPPCQQIHRKNFLHSFHKKHPKSKYVTLTPTACCVGSAPFSHLTSQTRGHGLSVSDKDMALTCSTSHFNWIWLICASHIYNWSFTSVNCCLETN